MGDDGSTQKIHQIALNPARIQAIKRSSDELNDSTILDFRELCQTVVHETAHYFEYEFGKRDKSDKPRKSGRHGRFFVNTMKYAGLYPSSTGEPGGDETGYHMAEYVIPGGRFEVAFNELLNERPVIWRDVRRQLIASTDEQTKPPKRQKFVCNKCGANVHGVPSKSGEVVCYPCLISLLSDQQIGLIQGIRMRVAE